MLLDIFLYGLIGGLVFGFILGFEIKRTGWLGK
jgi:hypothetical protein